MRIKKIISYRYSDISLMYHWILVTSNKRQVWESVTRVWDWIETVYGLQGPLARSDFPHVRFLRLNKEIFKHENNPEESSRIYWFITSLKLQIINSWLWFKWFLLCTSYLYHLFYVIILLYDSSAQYSFNIQIKLSCASCTNALLFSSLGRVLYVIYLLHRNLLQSANNIYTFSQTF